MKTYIGRRREQNSWEVFVRDGSQNKPLNPRNDLYNHSPTGFAWGYGGSGPAQLALALLADATGDDRFALDVYQSFKWAHIARLPQETGWEMDETLVHNWISTNRGGD